MIFPMLLGAGARLGSTAIGAYAAKHAHSMIGDAMRATAGKAKDVLNGIHSPSDATDLNGLINDQTGGLLKDFENLFETSETAAVNQAQRNEAAAVEAWKRSEQSAERAMKRTRELRQTAYQDAVASLKAAGLNPVLAASNGISGSSATAPMASAASSQSGMAEGLKAADILSVLSNYVSSVKSLLSGFVPSFK